MEPNSQKNDFVWWIVTSILGVAFWAIPLQLDTPLSQGTRILIAVTLIFLLSGVVSYLKPDRPWRWGIACVLLIPIVEGIKDFNIFMFLIGIITSIPLLIPTMIGVYVGAVIHSLIDKKDGLSILKKNKTLWIAFFLGLLVSAFPLFIFQQEQFYLYWFLGLFLCSGIFSYLQPVRVWRWAISVGLGLPTIIIIRIIIDSIKGFPEHNLFPIEIAISISLAAIATFSSAFIFMMIAEKIKGTKKDSVY